MGAKIRKQTINPILIKLVHGIRIFLYFCGRYWLLAVAVEL